MPSVFELQGHIGIWKLLDRNLALDLASFFALCFFALCFEKPADWILGHLIETGVGNSLVAYQGQTAPEKVPLPSKS